MSHPGGWTDGGYYGPNSWVDKSRTYDTEAECLQQALAHDPTARYINWWKNKGGCVIKQDHSGNPTVTGNSKRRYKYCQIAAGARALPVYEYSLTLRGWIASRFAA